jgi:hypothetical protein
MSSLGQWLGRWAGAWFGLGESDPNAVAAAGTITVGGSATVSAIGWMSASATVSLGGTGTLTDANAVQPQPGGSGRGFLPERRRRRDTDDDVLLVLLTRP